MRDGSLLFRWEDAGTWSSTRLLGRVTPKQQQVAELKVNLAQHSPEVWKGGLEQGYKYRSAVHALLQAQTSMTACAERLASKHSAPCNIVVPQSSGTARGEQDAGCPCTRTLHFCSLPQQAASGQPCAQAVEGAAADRVQQPGGLV